MTAISQRSPRSPMQTCRVPLSALITSRDAMEEVLSSGRASDTPNEPIYLVPREDMPGRWEISDGHHRVAAALRSGKTHIVADINPTPDDEPYEPPFYPFAGSVQH